MVLEELDIHMRKNELGPLINSKWIKEPSRRAKIRKCLKDNRDQSS